MAMRVSRNFFRRLLLNFLGLTAVSAFLAGFIFSILLGIVSVTEYGPIYAPIFLIPVIILAAGITIWEIFW